MFLKGGLILTLCAATFAVQYGTEKCTRDWEKIGCFKDVVTPSRPLPDELLNRRDPINKNWDGKTINWHDYQTTLHALACKCSELAKARGHKVFGLQFYGECWSGNNALYLFARDGVAENKDCVGIDYQPCDDNSKTECVGKAFRNYIYKIKEGGKDIDQKVPGNWGDWSQWSPCSKKCAGGTRDRFRECNNPAPKFGGKYCEGEGEAMEACNEEACQPVCKKQLDIGVILDGSTSVTKKNWLKTLDFVKSFASEFSVSEQEVHFGVMHFSWRVTVDFKISDSRYWSQEALESKVDTIQYPYGGTRTDLALDTAYSEFFCKGCTERASKVPKVLLVLTDGKSSYNAKPVVTASEPIKKAGVTIIGIGVGQADKTELTEMATDADHVFMLNQYAYLKDKLNSMLKLACQSDESRRRRSLLKSGR